MLNSQQPSLRLAAIKNIDSDCIIERRNDTVYQVRQQLCSRLVSVECKLSDKLAVLKEKTTDKNVYVRKTAFTAL